MSRQSENALAKKSFLENILILISGTTVAQAIPVLISPILTRIAKFFR